MRVYIAPVSSFTQYAESLRSLYKVKVRPEDTTSNNHFDDDKLLCKGRGDISRSYHCQKFLESDYDAMWMVDADMRFHPNCLEHLRRHDLPIVTGHYFRRNNNTVSSIIAVSDTNKIPYGRLKYIPDSGLHSEFGGAEIANCGFGNVLIKREVIERVAKLLRPGEPPMALGSFPEVTDGSYLTMGADYRFFAMARSLGYKIALEANPEAEAEHGVVFWLNREFYRKHKES